MTTKRICHYCLSDNPKYKCADCEKAFYCNAKCQISHWMTHQNGCVQKKNWEDDDNVSDSDDLYIGNQFSTGRKFKTFKNTTETDNMVVSYLKKLSKKIKRHCKNKKHNDVLCGDTVTSSGGIDGANALIAPFLDVRKFQKMTENTKVEKLKEIRWKVLNSEHRNFDSGYITITNFMIAYKKKDYDFVREDFMDYLEEIKNEDKLKVMLQILDKELSDTEKKDYKNPKDQKTRDESIDTLQEIITGNNDQDELDKQAKLAYSVDTFKNAVRNNKPANQIAIWAKGIKTHSRNNAKVHIFEYYEDVLEKLQ